MSKKKEKPAPEKKTLEPKKKAPEPKKKAPRARHVRDIPIEEFVLADNLIPVRGAKVISRVPRRGVRAIVPLRRMRRAAKIMRLWENDAPKDLYDASNVGWSSKRVSSPHFAIGPDGEVVQYIDPFTNCGICDGSIDGMTIVIVNLGKGTKPTEKQAKICGDLMKILRRFARYPTEVDEWEV